jgi:uncharacterized membrane protein YgcG
MSSFYFILILIAVIVVASVMAGWSYRRTQNQARLMKKSLGMHVSDDATFDGGFDGGGGSADGGGD